MPHLGSAGYRQSPGPGGASRRRGKARALPSTPVPPWWQDKDFGKQALRKEHVNPPAEVSTSLKTYQHFTLEKAYLREDFFWAFTPAAGDFIRFRFFQPLRLERSVPVPLGPPWGRGRVATRARFLDLHMPLFEHPQQVT